MSVRFSVVIPTRDRNDLLARCLHQLAPSSQRLPASEYEVIVTDDSPHETARAMVAEHFPWARWVAGPRRGPAANRNRGARAGTGELVVFVDDDCLPEPGLLAGYTAALRDSVPVYEGRTTCRAGATSPLHTAPENLNGGQLWSCNFAIRRATFTAVNGFDERFPLPHMEDADLRERLRMVAQTIVFVPAATVDHPPRRLPWGARLARMHQATVLYMVLHPPARSLGWFLQNELRAKLSRIVHRRKSLDSLVALSSLPVELATIALNWQRWMRWARDAAGAGR